MSLTWFYHVSQQVSTHVYGRGIVPIEILNQRTPTQMCSRTTDWVEYVYTEISAQEVDEIMCSLLPTTNTFIESWKVEKSTVVFSSALQKHTSTMHDRIRDIVEQICNSETLRDETEHTITVFSMVVEASQSASQTKEQGILHPPSKFRRMCGGRKNPASANAPHYRGPPSYRACSG